MKLLIVDDSALVRRSIESVYRGQRFTDIKTASDGLLAVTLYKEFSPDVVTLDITMPHMDGLAALTEMLAHNDRAAILVISALADHHTAIEALKRGAKQFICKPFTSEDLKEALDDLVQEHGVSEDIALDGPSQHEEREIEKKILKLAQSASSAVKGTESTKPSPEDYPSGYVEPPSAQPNS